mmetsp:Transcript_7638/g.10880  ORF Transcript_7638/g.10880 Transcript_7638/m.10880 type:complete len:582 (+) Transcript_7638:165-1910(+)
MATRMASRQSHHQHQHYHCPPRSPLHVSLSERQQDHPLYLSPRCNSRFHDTMVDDPRTDPSLQSHEGRWKLISEQAGSHRQDGSLMVLPRRVSPKALRLGTPRLAAARVRALHIPLNQTDSLPEWIDTITSIFFNLEHLYLTDVNSSSPSSKQNETENGRMRRLYVLYRLPDLKSINGKAVKESERQVARPMSPSGHKVKRDEWVRFNSPGKERKNKANGQRKKSEEDGQTVKIKSRNIRRRSLQSRGLRIDTSSPDTGDNEEEEKVREKSKELIGVPTAKSLAHAKYDNQVNNCYSPMTNCGPAEESVAASCGVMQLPHFNQLSIHQNQPRLRTLSEDVKAIQIQKPRRSPEWNNKSGNSRRERVRSAPNSPSSNSFADATLDLRNTQTFRLVQDQPSVSTIPTASSSDTESGPTIQRDHGIPSVKRISSASRLSSPFPMQFRDKASPRRRNESNPEHELTMPPLSSSSSMDSKNDQNQMPMSPSNLDRKLSKPLNIRIDPPGEKAMVYGTTNLEAKNERVIEHNSKPPKCPSSRRIVATTPRRSQKKNRNKIRRILKVKSASIMDFDDESSSTEEEDSS